MPIGGMVPRQVPMVNGHMSFARLFASQPTLAVPVGWLLRQSTRVPLKVYKHTGGDSRDRLRPGEHRLSTAIESPWELGSRIDLVQALLGPYLIHGNGLAEVELVGNDIRFIPADWRFVNPVLLYRDEIAGWELDVDIPMKRRTRSSAAVLHVRNWSPFGPIGLSPLQQLGVTVAIDDAAQRHQRAMLANGVRSATVVQTTDDRFLGLRAEERAELMGGLREDVRETQAGPENSGLPWIVPPGLEVKPVGQTAVEADLIEQRHVARQEAISVFGLFPGALGIIEGRANELSEQRQMAYVDGLAPPLLMVENAVNAQLVNGVLREPDVYVEFDFAGILRGDRLKEIEALREAIATALMSPSEGRKVLNLPTDGLPPQMDEFYLPFNNLWPISQPPPKSGERDLQQAVAALNGNVTP